MAINRYIYGIILLLVIFINQPNIFAQTLHGVSDNAVNKQTGSVQPTHISHILRETDSYIDIKRKIERQKRKLKGKLRSSISLGDTSSFFVRNIFTLDTWNTISAECIYISADFALWIGEEDKAFYSDSLNIGQIVDSLAYRLQSASYAGSTNPSKGIIELNTEYFGSIPDIDGDGRYNHLEIRRVKRLYTQGANKKGDLALPMQQTKQWIENRILK